ncbi:MAG: Na+/H+ antiporter NhaA [Actinomycetes bacterium]
MARVITAPHVFLRRFVEVETRAAFAIVLAAVLGVLLASMPFGDDLTRHLTDLHLRAVITEIAVCGFFLLIGLELRREAAHGALSGPVASVAATAAVLGMAVPTAVYLLAAPSGARAGWVAVVATDIAVASAIALLGVPTEPARVLLLTIAIFDDLGAVAALAFFGGHAPDLVWLPVIVGLIAGYAWAARRYRLGGLVALIVVVGASALSIKAGFHPSLAAFAVGFAVPRAAGRRSDEPVDERIERRLHPWIAGLALPLFVLVQTMVPLRLRPGSPASLILITLVAVFLGKTVGVAGVLAVTRRIHGITPTECVAIGFAAAAALTVALIGVDATLRRTPFAQPVSLGILAATALAAVAGVTAGRLATRRATRRSPG